MDQNNLDPKLKNILEQLSKFGFSFMGFDENGGPLVKGSNGQIVPINTAINFVNQFIKSQQNQGGGGPENPNINNNENLDVSAQAENASESAPESSVETSIETSQENSMETSAESAGESANNTGNLAVQQKAPQIKFEPPKPYGGGFDPNFNVHNIQEVQNFIEKNSKTSKTKSDKWVAELFKKFLKEMENNVKK